MRSTSTLPLTGSQTVGPYFAIGLQDLFAKEIPHAGGDNLYTVEGLLLDAGGVPIPDGVIELWQADASGRYARQPACSAAEAHGFARVKTEADGSFRFTTAKPGSVPFDGCRMQAPHILVLVYMRGLLRHLVTRLYFPDEAANATDPVLDLVPAERRATLIAEASGVPARLRWNIVARSEAPSTHAETVFFAW